MPNSENIRKPIVFTGLGRSGTSAITQILSYHPEIENVGEVSPVIWDLHDAVHFCSINMRYPTPQGESINRADLPIKVVRDLFLTNYASDQKAWMIKPIGPIGRVRDLFTTRSDDKLFLDWYFGVLIGCFPDAQVFTLVRDPLDYARSARRYWGASFKNVRGDIQFMSLLLRSGRIPAGNIIGMVDFRANPRAALDQILMKAGAAEYAFDENLFSQQYASEQGRATKGPSGSTEAIAPFTPEEEAALLREIGPEYDPFVKPETKAYRIETSNATVAPDDVDYRLKYHNLIDEFNFLKTRVSGMETLINEKEDIVHGLLKWIKILEAKAERFAATLREAKVPLPPASEKDLIGEAESGTQD